MLIPPMSVERCVSETLRALARNRARCIPGRINRVTAALAPPGLTRTMMAAMLSHPDRVQHSRPVGHSAGPPAQRT